MSNWVITKEFEFDFGHRVWSQKLDCGFSIDSKCKCRFLHGHRGKIIVKLSSDHLTNGMVTDFKHLNVFRKFIDDTLDHKFLFDLSDPLVLQEFPDVQAFPVVDSSILNIQDFLASSFASAWQYNLLHNDNINDSLHRHWWTLNVNSFDVPEHVREKYEGVVFLPFIPTAELLSSWLYSILSKMLEGLNVNLHSLVFFETPKASSEFYLESQK